VDELSVQIAMPKWGHLMEEGKITRWFKDEGDTVEKGEDLFEVETEKITNIVEANASGILFQILVPVGAIAPVGAVVAILAEAGEQLERIDSNKEIKQELEGKVKSEKKVSDSHLELSNKGFVRATPAARRIAKERRIDLQTIRGTGPEGRVTEQDVTQHHQKPPRPPKTTPLASELARQANLDLSTLAGTGYGGKIMAEDVEHVLAAKAAEPLKSIPFKGIRKTIAENMHTSLMHTAQLTVFTEVDVTELVRSIDLFLTENQGTEKRKVSYNDFLILAVSRALTRFPMMNSTLIEDEILLHDVVNLGIAVALADGLIVPVLKEANKKGLTQIATESRRLAHRAREGRLTVDEVTGGTFTISNLSMFDIDGITPILRSPETAIMGCGRIKEKPAVYQGEIAIRSMTTLCLTFDHRVVDGAPASQFLQAVARMLQEPIMLLA
jgi:pyruvate dehydrogenase E2 component (dihydrolipoamide acetyltransferase)